MPNRTERNRSRLSLEKPLGHQQVGKAVLQKRTSQLIQRFRSDQITQATAFWGPMHVANRPFNLVEFPHVLRSRFPT